MQVHRPRDNLHKYLLLTVISIGFLILFATFFGKETVKIVTDITYIPVTATLVVLSSILVLRFRQSGNHGKAWLFFLGSSISWFIAETTWTVYDLVFNVNPFPSLADIFYLGGYTFLFFFLMYYLKPVRKAASKRMVLGVITISVAMMIPSIYMAYNFDPKVGIIENLLATSYPVADAIVIVPSLIGIVLFFKGEVNFTWSLICLAIVLLSIGDTGFQFATYTNTYYTGHPVDIVFLCNYILLSFGVFDHIQIFKKPKADNKPKQKFDEFSSV